MQGGLCFLRDIVDIPILFGGQDHIGHSLVRAHSHLTYVNSIIFAVQREM